MAKYTTKQRKILLTYLSAHHDESLTPRSIAAALEPKGVSLSAVYRNLSVLEEEGRVRRVVAGTNREACFQYADADECRESLHLSCLTCGRTFHMAVPDVNLIESQLEQNERFAIDRASKVLYGTCADCRQRGQEKLS